jgi:hypothetical protein
MINKKTSSDLSAGMYLDTGKETANMRKKSGAEKPFLSPQKMGDPVNPDGVESRIAGKDFHDASGGRVFPEYYLDIFFYRFKKFHC